MRVLNWLAIGAIVAYQLTLSRVLRRLGLRCRHIPTCSVYGVLAFRKYPFRTASALTWRRYRDCRPGSDRPVVDFP